MKYIDPSEFSRFIRNELPKERMIEVEQEMLENGTANAALLALIDEYESCEDVEEIIGKDEEEYDLWKNSEKILEDACKKIGYADSYEINNKIKRNMNNLKISKEDMAKVADRYQSLRSSYDASLPLDQNLKLSYKAAHPSATEEEASTVVEKLIKGCEELTSGYNKALAEGFDASAEINALTREMSVAERFRFLVNALSAVEALDLAAFPSQVNVKDAVEEVIRKYTEATPDPTEADCDTLQNLLADALSNNTLILAGSEKAQELLESAGASDTVIDFTAANFDDARIKAEMALAMWLEYEAGNLSSVELGATPEAIGIGAAVAVEEAKVMNDVATGKSTGDMAVKCLKILGGVALFLLLGYVAVVGISFISAAAAVGLISLFGTSVVACVASLVICLPLMWGLAEKAVGAGAYIMEKAGQAFDFVVEKLRESVFPKIKEVANRFISWVKAKLGESKATAEDAAVVMA